VQAAKELLTSILGIGHLGRKAPSPEKKRAVSEDQESCSRQASRPLLISLKVRSVQENVCLHKLMSIVHRMSIKLESGFLDSLRIKAETLQRNPSVRNVNNTPCT